MLKNVYENPAIREGEAPAEPSSQGRLISAEASPSPFRTHMVDENAPPGNATEPASPPRRSSPPSPKAAPGRTLGKYLLLEKLGRGGSCAVFRALHQSLNVSVAIKVVDLDPDDPTFPRASQQLRSEAQILGRLSHPHIVRVFDFEDEPRVPYLVLECVDGATLRELIQQSGRLQTERARKLLGQVVDALVALWDLGFVHRDVKPGNILLTRDGTAKLADLGQAASFVENASRSCRAQAAEPEDGGGTAAYLAPEQVLAPAAVDPRSDMYSLGVTFYEAVTGRLPFEGRSRLEVVCKHAREAPPPPRRFVPDLDPTFEELLLTLLAKDPDDRFASAQDLLAALHRLAPTLPSRDQEGEAPAKPQRPPTVPVRQKFRPPPRGPQLVPFWRALLAHWGISTPATRPQQKDAWLSSMKRTLLGSARTSARRPAGNGITLRGMA